MAFDTGRESEAEGRLELTASGRTAIYSEVPEWTVDTGCVRRLFFAGGD